MKSRCHVVVRTKAPRSIYVGKLMKEWPIEQELWLMPTETPIAQQDPLITLIENQGTSAKVNRTKREIKMELARKVQEENIRQNMEANSNVAPCEVLVPNFESFNIDPFLMFENFSLAGGR